MNPINYTGLLYAGPSIWSGLTRILDIGGHLDEYNTADSPKEADALAIASDWYAVGADLHRAIERYMALVKRSDATYE